MKGQPRLQQLLIVYLLSQFLFACTAINTAHKKSDIKIHSKLTQTIFLDPVAPDKRTVFVQYRNNSDSEQFDIAPFIEQNLSRNGYRVTDDPEQATYWLQANVRYVGSPHGDGFQDAMDDAGGAIEGAVLGAGISDAVGGRGSDNVKAAVVMGLIGYMLDSMVDDVYHTSITDLQISERIKGQVNTQSDHHLSQGESGQEIQQVTTTSNRKKYQTRILITGNQANMNLNLAEAKMSKKLTKVINGLF